VNYQIILLGVLSIIEKLRSIGQFFFRHLGCCCGKYNFLCYNRIMRLRAVYHWKLRPSFMLRLQPNKQPSFNCIFCIRLYFSGLELPPVTITNIGSYQRQLKFVLVKLVEDSQYEINTKLRCHFLSYAMPIHSAQRLAEYVLYMGSICSGKCKYCTNHYVPSCCCCCCCKILGIRNKNHHPILTW
jgi:hypothetical protein